MSRDKGNKAEIEIAHTIQPWWRLHEPEANFVRTPLSGGWGAPTLRAGFRASGDLMTNAKDFPFAVEVKRRESWSWAPLLAGKASPIWGWWLQTQTAAKEMKAEPILFWRKNREPWWVMLRETFCQNRRLYTAEVDIRWQVDDPLRRLNVGDHPRAFPAEHFFAFPPARFVLSHDRVGSRRRAHGEKEGRSG